MSKSDCYWDIAEDIIAATVVLSKATTPEDNPMENPVCKKAAEDFAGSTNKKIRNGLEHGRLTAKEADSLIDSLGRLGYAVKMCRKEKIGRIVLGAF